jgi:hypothetical protein
MFLSLDNMSFLPGVRFSDRAGVWFKGPKNRPRSLFDTGIFLLDKGAQGAYLADSPQWSGHLQAA